MLVEIFAALEQYTWILALSFIFAFIVAFGMGANDVANSFATSVGSKVLTLKQACIIAAFAEFLGAVTLGGRVTETIKKGIADPEDFEDTPEVLMLGMFTVCIATAFWLLLATYLKVPVSSSHSVVASIMGFAIVAEGWNAVDWMEFLKIVVSWVISPVLSGIISGIVYLSVKYSVLVKSNSFEAGLKAVPIIYACTLFVNVTPVANQIFSVIHDSNGEDWVPPYPEWGPLVISISVGVGVGILTGLFVAFFVVPRQKKQILMTFTLLEETNEKEKLLASEKADTEPSETVDGVDKKHSVNDTYGAIEDPAGPIEDKKAGIDQQKTETLFSFLQTLTATFNSFVHGSNDVSNAIGPLSTIYSIWLTGSVHSTSDTEIWILAYGGVGIVLGLAIWGRRVIETLGTNMTHLSPSRGFTIELGAALTVLIASRAGIPVSTTHCMVGSVMAVGWISNGGSVSWKLFGKIFLSWIITIPAGALVSAAFFAALRPTLYL